VSVPTRGAAVTSTKIVELTGAEKAQCVFWIEETRSAMQVQRFHTHCNRNPPSRTSVYEWHRNCVCTGCCVTHAKKTGRPSVNNKTGEELRRSFSKVRENQQHMQATNWVCHNQPFRKCYGNVCN
jgi:hypothetical protein